MRQPASAPFLRRAFDWWLAQVKRAAANHLLLRRLQPRPMDQAPDLRGAWHRVQWPFDSYGSRLAGRQGGSRNRPPAVHASLRWRAADPTDPVQECGLLAMRTCGTAR